MFNQYQSPTGQVPTYPYGCNPYGFQQRSEVVSVSGEEGAKAYPLGPNSSILLLDSENPIVYLKRTDGGGYPTITAYNTS